MEMIPVTSQSISIGQLANEYASQNVFSDYQLKVAANTLKRQRADIDLFSTFLRIVGMNAADLMHNPAEWYGITFGLIEAFKKWQLEKEYAIFSISAHISTIRFTLVLL